MAASTIAILLGTTRRGRQGQHVARLILQALEQRGNKVYLIDPNEHEELLVLRVPKHYDPHPSADMQRISDWLKESDGIILVSPEYNHSFSGALKNMLDQFMPEYEKKAFGIATYSANFTGGARANEMLRIVVSELKAVPTPIPFMVSNIQEVFDAGGALRDESYTRRLTAFLDDFEWYVQALRAARQAWREQAAKEQKAGEAAA